MRLNKRKIVAVLRQNGYKLTPQRRAVIQTIAANQDHLTPAAMYERVQKEHPHIGLVTIYRTLELLTRLNLICELRTGGNCPSYTAGAPEHHHHIICDSCGRVVDFSGYDLAELEQQLTQETRFKINRHILEFVGLCQTCQRETT